VQGGERVEKQREAAHSCYLWLPLACFLILNLPLPAPGQKPGSAYVETVLSIQHQIEAHDLVGARASIAEAMKKYPDNGGIENLLGIVEIQQGDVTGARQALSAAVRDDPRLVSAFLNLARIDMQAGFSDAAVQNEAMRLDERVLELDPRNDEANYQIATILTWQKSYRRSLDHLQKLSGHARARIEAEDLLCTDYAALGDREGTDAAANSLIANPDLSEEDANSCLPALRAAHRADLIDKIFTAANEKHTLSAAGQRILGLAQEAEGKLTQARATLEGAFAAGDHSVAVFVDLTRVAKAEKDYKGALGYLAHARELDPKDASLPYEFGVLCLQLDLYGESRKAIAEAVKLAPNNPDYNFAMGTLVSFSDDPSQALPYLAKYHAYRPQDPEGLLALGAANFRAKDYETSVKWLKQAVKYPRTAPDAHFYLGQIDRQELHLDEATAELKQSLALRPEQPEVLAELGQVCIETHDYAVAQTYFGRALHLDPDNYGANFGLLQLYARTGDPRRDAQSKRFDEIKNEEFQQDRQMMRVLEIRPSG
jgi:tetratricopeptide (TPR) repeat protein